MSDTNIGDTSSNETPEARESYTTPDLLRHGTVADLTEGAVPVIVGDIGSNIVVV